MRGQPRNWLSHEHGADILIDYLRNELARPDIPDSGALFEEFFVKIRRRRGESMQSWTTRHRDTYERMRVALARVLDSHGAKEKHKATNSWGSREWGQQTWWSGYTPNADREDHDDTKTETENATEEEGAEIAEESRSWTSQETTLVPSRERESSRR